MRSIQASRRGEWHINRLSREAVSQRIDTPIRELLIESSAACSLLSLN